MNTLPRNKIQSAVLSIAMIPIVFVMAGCDRAERSADSYRVGQPAGDQQPQGHVMESGGFTLRANVSRTDALPETMAQKYGIEPEPDLFLLNLVILEDRPDRQPVTVSGKVNAKHESLIGHSKTIEMRAVEANGHVSYIGTLDGSDQRFFQFVIAVQPVGADQPLRMSFEVQLEAFEIGDFE